MVEALGKQARNLRFKAVSRRRPIRIRKKEGNTEFTAFLKAWGGRAPAGQLAVESSDFFLPKPPFLSIPLLYLN